MENTELKSKKRKRKHTTELGEAKIPLAQENDARDVPASVNGTANAEPHKKKKKKQGHQDNPKSLVESTMKPIRDDIKKRVLAEVAPVEERTEEENDTAVLAPGDAFKDRDAMGNPSLESVAEEEETIATSTTNREDASTETDVPSAVALSLPSTGSDPITFRDLNLSSKTMQAISGMNFEKMTEIQSRGIPPL